MTEKARVSRRTFLEERTMMQEHPKMKQSETQFYEQPIEITGWSDGQIAEAFPGTVQILAVVDEKDHRFVYATTTASQRESFVAAIRENGSTKKLDWSKALFIDGAVAIEQLHAALPGIAREYCDS